MTFLVATDQALLIARRASQWSVEEHLRGHSPECVAVDPINPSRVYCGTWGHGVWRSNDAGGKWEPVGAGIAHPEITAVAVNPLERRRRFGEVYAGTEPSAVLRSDAGDENWGELRRLRPLTSAGTGS